MTLVEDLRGLRLLNGHRPRDMRISVGHQEGDGRASPALPTHPYIVRKKIDHIHLLQDTAGRLVIPMQDETSTIWNVQTIDYAGRKFYLPGRKHGLLHMLGRAENGKPFGIAEGVATAATVREATGLPVAVAFDAGNLLPVAETLRTLYPSSPIILFGDDDRFLPLRSPALPNVGREKAIEAAAAVGGRVMFPEFAAGEDGTDFNDLAHAIGIEAVRDALAPARSSLRAAFAAPAPLA